MVNDKLDDVLWRVIAALRLSCFQIVPDGNDAVFQDDCFGEILFISIANDVGWHCAKTGFVQLFNERG